MKILYTTNEIRKAITELFVNSSARRVAVVAFVGEGAESFLPSPRGMELVCWAKAGGTSANSLRRLKRRGAEIYFADSLHMKLYWAEGKGAVITSANLSSNALGSGNLREIGVHVSSDAVDIDRVLSLINRKTLTRRDLVRLDREGRDVEMALLKSSSVLPRSAQINFKQWYEDPYRRDWKLGWWRGDIETSKVARKISRQQYGISEPNQSLCCKETHYRRGDWVLTFGLLSNKPTQLTWRTVDFVVKVPRADKDAYSRGYPFHAIQVWPLSRYPAPPFALEKRFREAFKNAIVGYGVKEIMQMKTSRAPNIILRRTYELY